MAAEEELEQREAEVVAGQLGLERTAAVAHQLEVLVEKLPRVQTAGDAVAAGVGPADVLGDLGSDSQGDCEDHDLEGAAKSWGAAESLGVCRWRETRAECEALVQ